MPVFHFEQSQKIYFGYCTGLSKLSEVCANSAIYIRNELGTTSNFDFPGLESFACEYMGKEKIDFHTELEHFLERHQNLAILKLCPIRGIDTNVIGRLRNLKVLHYNAKSRVSNEFENQINTAGLEQLTTLKSLVLFCDGDNSSRFLNESASAESMEHLSIALCDSDDLFFDGLNRFRNLRTMELDRMFGLTDERLNRLHLEQLVELIFIDCFDITKDGIIEFIEAHRKLQRILLAHTLISIDRNTYGRIANICKSQDRYLTMQCYSRILYEARFEKLLMNQEELNQEEEGKNATNFLAMDINSDPHFIVDENEEIDNFPVEFFDEPYL